jgi:hypothetical protein
LIILLVRAMALTHAGREDGAGVGCGEQWSITIWVLASGIYACCGAKGFIALSASIGTGGLGYSASGDAFAMACLSTAILAGFEPTAPSAGLFKRLMIPCKDKYFNLSMRQDANGTAEACYRDEHGTERDSSCVALAMAVSIE